jgi:hypothetical protein
VSQDNFTTPETYIQAKYLSLSSGASPRELATEAESKDPEDFSSIHAASGSFHKTLSFVVPQQMTATITLIRQRLI